MEGHVFAGFSLPLLSLVVKQTVLDLFGKLSSLEVASMVRSIIANLSISPQIFLLQDFSGGKIRTACFFINFYLTQVHSNSETQQLSTQNLYFTSKLREFLFASHQNERILTLILNLSAKPSSLQELSWA